MDSITMETCGDCLGPADFYDEQYEETLQLVKEKWEQTEEMSPDEARERIEHLADEWGLTLEELACLN